MGTDKTDIERLSLALKTDNMFEGKAINYKKGRHTLYYVLASASDQSR